MPRRIEILGVPVDCVTMASALDAVDDLVQGKHAGKIIAVNPEKVIEAGRRPELLAHLRSAALLIPDGIGIVWAANLLGLGRMERVPGADLMPAICARAVVRGYKVFLFGARPGVAELASEILANRYPGLQIAGTHHGYVKDAEMPSLIERINQSGAHILFIALGSPRQEEWMGRYLPELNVKVCQGVGGTFDVLAGTVRRAPSLWQWANLEWAFRLLSQPNRALRQTALPRFAWQVLAQRFSRG